jgi:transcriptional regulator with XRE-family HTH domain
MTDQPDQVNPALEIGVRLAAHRTRRAMKVSGLARQVGVSPSLISQIERGQSRPSVSTLFALAEALDVPVDAFFRDSHKPPAQTELDEPQPGAAPAPDAAPKEHRHLVRRDERAVIDIEGGVRWERLTPTHLDDVEFLELVYEPGAESHPSLYRHPGMEMVLVLSGRMDIFVGFDRHELEPGDSICFPSTTPHRYLNPTGETTRAVTVILPDGWPSGPPRQAARG